MTQTHPALILPEKGSPLTLTTRPTPTPDPNEVLIEIKALALNPIDLYQRDFGLPPIPSCPAVLGSDVTGYLRAIGPNTPPSSLPPIGSRVIALASSYYQNGSPDHGAFQKYALAQYEAVIPLPDDLSFEQGAVFPLGIMTALTGWTTMDIPLNTRFTPEDKQGVLIWGAASSVGSFAVQTAKIMGFRVYATASEKHHEYIKSLGAEKAFDYKDQDVVRKIIVAVKEDGVKLYNAHAVVDGALQPVLDVLKQTKGEYHAKVVNSPALKDGHPTLEDTTIRFNYPSLEKEERDKHIKGIFHGFVAENLKEGKLVPSPNLQIEEGGLEEGVNAGLDKLSDGVSGKKIVVPI
ncbi:chaperonin 10-like protein [Podospora fimiseda]|uniref:Chaperonin 10-like protein n=1 Tax=Podospora fimiseda TaxID=252190 RepID=A0AAN7BG43_9PEZI|nr:chaperonin 10-like protein [Podospora fimiseda]